MNDHLTPAARESIKRIWGTSAHDSIICAGCHYRTFGPEVPRCSHPRADQLDSGIGAYRMIPCAKARRIPYLFALIFRQCGIRGRWYTPARPF